MTQQATAEPITPEQLRGREISAAGLLAAAPAGHARPGIVHAASAPLSVFGRKVAGHDG